MKVIILAGGSGTRLWPLSRELYPKQFVILEQGKPSLFQQTFLRCLKLVDYKDIYIITNAKYQFLVKGSIEEIGHTYSKQNLILEPEAKNTLPAIYAGVYQIFKDHGNNQIIVFPADHIIKKEDAFINDIKVSLKISINNIVTFGIKPDSPHIGYGYICPGKKILNGSFLVSKFKEKPSLEQAKKYVKLGYLWNSGIFMFNAKLMINEVKKFAIDIYKAFENSNDISQAFSKIKQPISIDYGIMEKTDKAVVIGTSIGWNDLGSFDAIYENAIKNKDKNVIKPTDFAINSFRNYTYSDSKKILLLIGINDLLIIDTYDCLLICKKSQSYKVQQIVKKLKENNDEKVLVNNINYRSWGSYKILEKSSDHLIKKINIDPNKSIKTQFHKHRTEHWTVISGKALISIDGKEQKLNSGESIFIKKRQSHKISNNTKQIVKIIEVQLGNILSEDIYIIEN